MPAVAAHYLFAQEVYRSLIRRGRKDIIALIRKDRSDYNIGSQGPDLLFYYQPTKPNEVTKYASSVHSQSGTVFMKNAMDRIHETKDLRTFAYMMGFVCHYALDSEAHPVINHYGKDSVGHIRIETELDRMILLREILKRDAKHRERRYIEKNQGKKWFSRKKDSNELVVYTPQFYSDKPSVKPEKIRRYRLLRWEEGLEKSIAGLYPSISETQIKKSLDSFVLYNRLMYSPSGANIAVLRKLEGIVKQRGVFSSLALTRKKFTEHIGHAEEILSIYDRMIEPATDLVINFYDAVRYQIGLSPRFEVPLDWRFDER
ncbi:MAG: zinc dependent phospholipase C family protein [Peptostreptococcaceae bacterium]|nr:zinc dependent phospholipase C family protein [Peptostreptococcaceae bacterium]